MKFGGNYVEPTHETDFHVSSTWKLRGTNTWNWLPREFHMETTWNQHTKTNFHVSSIKQIRWKLRGTNTQNWLPREFHMILFDFHTILIRNSVETTWKLHVCFTSTWVPHNMLEYPHNRGTFPIISFGLHVIFTHFHFWTGWYPLISIPMSILFCWNYNGTHHRLMSYTQSQYDIHVSPCGFQWLLCGTWMETKSQWCGYTWISLDTRVDIC
jgi:hypothetical protein